MSHKKAKQKRKKTAEDLRSLLLLVMKRFRRVLARRGPELYKRFPNMRRPCHTCAFNPATDGWAGMDKTVLGLLHALGSGDAFYCHEGMPIVDGEYSPAGMDWDDLNVCGGWAAIVGDPEAEAALFHALREWKDRPQPDAPISPEMARAFLHLFTQEATGPMVKKGSIAYASKRP